VVRNNSTVEIMPRLPTDTRDANRQEAVWQSLVTANASHKLYGNPTNSVDRGRVCLVLRNHPCPHAARAQARDENVIEAF
jgi:hypothetical protein